MSKKGKEQLALFKEKSTPKKQIPKHTPEEIMAIGKAGFSVIDDALSGKKMSSEEAESAVQRKIIEELAKIGKKPPTTQKIIDELARIDEERRDNKIGEAFQDENLYKRPGRK